MVPADPLPDLRRKLAAAVELCAREAVRGHAALWGRGTAMMEASLPAGAWTFERSESLESKVRGPSAVTLLVATDLPSASAEIDRVCAHFAGFVADRAILLAEMPSEAREGWRLGLERAGFGELRMASSPPTSGSCELLMARYLGAKAAQSEPGNQLRPENEKHTILAQVCTTLAKLLRLSPGDLDPTSPFSDYGVDSMAGVAFVNELNRALGLELKPMVLFDYTTAEKLAGFIATQGSIFRPVNATSSPRSATTVALAAPRESQQPVRSEDIAVIGLAGRFPGAADVEEFWRNLRAGVSSITEVPTERWDHGALYDPDSKSPGKTPFKWGGFLADADKFDPLFFSISGREAEAMDPQQRLFLEECYHALEDAGYAGASTRTARKCGVFAGVEPGDYMQLAAAVAETGEKAPLFQGNAESILAARISYFLDLKGPSLAINTACSSSLVAIHLACQSLVRGECDLALAGGVRVFATGKVYLALGNMGMLAADGRCKTFDAAADGFVPGEAVGVLVLKPLAAALRDGDTIHGVFKGSAINQDGRTNGITAPSSLAQTEVQREAYARAGVSPASFDYVEAHGTGTKLGDPIEVQALTTTFRHYTQATAFCALGSVKTNIGHTMAAAGVCGAIKVLLALRHGEMPPSLNLTQQNPYIDFASSPFRTLEAPAPWPAKLGRPRRAALSSFGFSGTNSHVVIEEPPGTTHRSPEPVGKGSQLVVVSARTPAALRELASRLRRGIADSAELSDIAFTLAVGRGHFEERAALVVANIGELRDKLEGLARGGVGAEVWRGSQIQGKLDPVDATLFPKLAELAVRELAAVGVGHSAEALRRERLGVLAALFAKGADLPWTLVFSPAARRISLPGYPFARERYWASAAAARPVTGKVKERFTGEEFFLRGHVVDGRPTLPGVMYLELARRAWREAGEFTLTSITWKRPLVVVSETEATVDFDITTGTFAVVAGGGVYADGRMKPAQPRAEQVEDIEAIRARCTRLGDSATIYSQCRAAGLELGGGMSSIVDIRFSDTEALARIEVDPIEAARFGWHPGILDGALQATAALGDGTGAGLPVPFALGEMWARKLPASCWAHVRREPAKGGVLQFGISLLDARGVVLGRLERMAMRALAREPASSSEAVWFKPVWRESAIDWTAGRALKGALLAVGGGVGWSEALQAAGPGLNVLACAFAQGRDWVAQVREVMPDYVIVRWPVGAGLDDGAPPLYDLCRALVREAGERSVEIRLIHAPGEALAAAAAGLGRTLRLEKPTLHFRVIEMAGDDAGAVLADVASAERVAKARILGSRRETEAAELLALADASGSSAIWREGGVYLITGGAGGLGAKISVDLARRYRARLVLVGRSSASEKVAALLAEIAASGGHARYMQANVLDGDSLARVVADARQSFGRLHGVLHIAGTLEDGFMRSKDTSAMLRVMGPKVTGLLALDAATRDEPLDFFGLFSSIAGVLGNVGQADYAWANCFLDEFSVLREARRSRGARHGITLSIAWPLWRDGGMQAGADLERLKLGQAGLHSLETQRGLMLLDQALAGGEPRLALLVGRGDAIRSLLAAASDKPFPVVESPTISPAMPVQPVASASLQDWLTARFAELVKLPASRIQPSDALEKYGIDSVMVMDFTQRLEAEFGELSKTLLFEHQTLAELADYFASHHSAVVARLVSQPSSVSSHGMESPSAPLPLPSERADASSSGEDIAIIGVAGRYPMADDLDTFWENLRAGRDCIVEIPAERWDYRAFYDPVPGKLGKTRNKWGGFLDGVERFDAAFFGVTPREAMALDPQERLFLETAWQTLEDAGYPKSALTNRQVGVFVGVMYGEYQLYGAGNASGAGVLPLSSSYASIANRVSYFFNWHGPSMAVDTMCSSSLTAIHLACASLLRGETELALAGGVNVTVHPHKDMLLAPGGFAASDGRCRSFGEGGDGYVPGEGVGALLLKPLARAQADGDHIWGVIKATAVNHGGKTNGYTVPNPKAQTEVVGTALARAGVAPGAVSYIEAHGTGTALGDPIEISALARAFGSERAVCSVGSVKSNIGHLESAAGVAGVTKVLLQMRHAQIAPSLHSARLNPNIRFDEAGFRVPQVLEPWMGGAHPRLAGVSSFGAGGANAHMVLAEYEARRDAKSDLGQEPAIFVLSAKNEDRLIARARQLLAWVKRNRSDASLSDLCWTLQVGREALEERLALVVSSMADLAQKLQRYVTSPADHHQVWRGRAHLETTPAASTAVASDSTPSTLARHWAQGGIVPWADLSAARQPRRISLPVYPFRGERYWAPDKLVGDKPKPTPAASVPMATAASEAIFLRPSWHVAARASPLGGSELRRVLLVGMDTASAQSFRAAYPKIEFTTATSRDDFRHYMPPVPAHVVWYAPESADLESSLEDGLRGLVRWSRAVLAPGLQSPVRVLFCHRPDQPAYAAMTGWARTFAQEHPYLQVTVIEVDQLDPSILSEFEEKVESREVRLRGSQRWVRVLERLDVPVVAASQAGAIKPGGAYLLTGGLGGIGRKLALFLARNFSTRLMMVGRSAARTEYEALLSAVHSVGGDCRYLQADVSTREGALAAASACRDAYGRIDGVIHSAGVLRDGFALKKSDSDYAAVLAPKVHGATWLDMATAEDRLDFFALFSSTAGTFGSVGQADYAFANAFLDAFAEQRARRVAKGERAGRTVSIGWPLWAEGGMPAGPEVLSRLAQAGLSPLPEEVGMQWLVSLLAANEVRVTPLWGDRDKVQALFLREPTQPSGLPTLPASSPALPALVERVEAYVRETLGSVIQMDASHIDLDVRFDEIGVDSIVVNDVNVRFERDLGAIPKTLLFEHPNVRRLARHLAEAQSAAFSRLWTLENERSQDKQPSVAATMPLGSLPTRTPSSLDDIAVIGLAGRFPGAPDVHRFWDVLREGRDEVTEIPPDRWDIAAHFDPSPEKAIEGKMYGRWGAFLRDVDKFDPLFFNLSPVEAEMMDPQERVFLEVAWHTLEDAGYTRRELRRWASREFSANVGVFVGVTSNSYALLGHAAGGAVAAPTSLPWSLANRISYLFNFNGPSMPVDTACSSSLTAVHLAVEAIRRGECQQAIAGGVNLYLHPSKYSHLSLMKMLSSDGKCRAFGDGGDGFVPGEGAGAVLLKPLSRALADGDRIWGVIKGTAVNHGGRTNGYTVPSPLAQADLVAKALESARVEPASISYLEAHGTGTALGDPIEIEGLSRALAREASAPPCAVGSAKTNIGHLESASGIAGLAKVLLQMRHRMLAPSLYAKPPNPRIDFQKTPLRIQTELGHWARPILRGQTIPRRAGVSSFGAGGSNAHVILEEAPERDSRERGGEVLIVLSAKNRERLCATAAGLLSYLQTESSASHSLADISWTLQAGREAMEERAVCRVDTFSGLIDRLQELVLGKVGGWSFGKVKRERVLASVEEGAELEQLPAGAWSLAAEKWLVGAEVDWRSLHGDLAPRRVSLPGYSFARDRYWMPAVPGVTVAATASLAVLPAEKPLRIAAADRVLADHVVQGTAVLPGAATLELLRTEAARTLGSDVVELRNVVWQRPITAGAEGISALLRVRSEGSGLACAIVDSKGDVFAQGAAGIFDARKASASGRLDVVAVRQRCTRHVDAGTLYAGFGERGIAYGDAFRVICSLCCGDGEALAELQVPAVWGSADRPLHPALVDGALQALGAIGAGEGGLEIPFAVAEVRSFRPCPPNVIAHVRRAADSAAGRRYDLRLFTLEGEVLAELIGLSVRQYGGTEARVNFGQVIWRSQRREVSQPWLGSVLVAGDDRKSFATDFSGFDVVWAEEGADAERLLRESRPSAIVVLGRSGAKAESGVLALHRWVQACIRVMGTKPVPIVFVYPEVASDLSGACGYIRSVRLEHPAWRLLTVATSGVVVLAEVIAELGGTENDLRLSSNGERAVREIQPRSLVSRQPALRRGGVYLVTGGLGGLGRIFAGYLLQQWDAHVMLVGRSQPGSPARQWLSQWGSRATYLREDVSRSGGADAIIQAALQQYGRLDGILHTAGVLRDGLARDRTEEDFSAVTAVKIDAARALAAAAEGAHCGWIVAFSSTAGVFGNAGQSVYAFANASLDAWAAEPGGSVRRVSIAWPLWREGGMRASEEAMRLQAETLGMHPLETSEGVEAFEQILASGAATCVVLKTSQRAVEKRAVTTPSVAVTAGIDAKKLVEDLRGMAAKVLRIDATLLDPETDTAEYGFDSVTFTSLANEVNRAFGLEVTPAVLFEHRTLAGFAQYLWSEHQAKLRPAAAPTIIQPPAMPVESSRVPVLAALATPSITSAPSREREPVAIVGISGVFPGASDLETFWKNLDSGHDAIGKPALDRWVVRPGEELPWGGFMADVDKFDALFFDISPREAELMDPQQRLMLQSVWRAIEDAGYKKSDFAGTKTGLFVGVAANDYANVLAHAGVEVEAYSSTGNAHSVLANRISYFFDLNGPSEAIDTACSSSLVAIHRAIESIESGSSAMAIVGGVNALLSPAGFTAFTRAGMLCADGRCKSFDARANGYVRGEGVGALVLKKLSHAVRDGDRIYATIRGSAENHGGHVQSLTVPNPNAQARLLQDAWARAGLDPSTLGLIEAHGTGTPLGDPIEINGLKKAFASSQAATEVTLPRCAIGAVKTNIGHLETAAGIAGVIKVLLAMRHGRIPGNVHLATLNPYIQVEGTPFYFPRSSEPWIRLRDASGRELPRRAGVSSFGFGGANAHIVLEEWTEIAKGGEASQSELIVLSARDDERLREVAAALKQRVESDDSISLQEIAYVLQLGREPLVERLAFVAANRAELCERLALAATGDVGGSGWRGNAGENGAATRLLRELHRDPSTLVPWLRARDLAKLAALWVSGVDVPWGAFYGDAKVRRVSLPGYPFAKVRHWVPVNRSVATRGAQLRGQSAHFTGRMAEFSVEIGNTDPVLADHVVQGTAVLPGAATLEIARAAAAVWQDIAVEDVQLIQVTWLRPVTSTAAGVRAVLRLRQQGDRVSFELLDTLGEVLLQGIAVRSTQDGERQALDLPAIRQRCTRSLSSTELYAALAQRGLVYGPAYRAIGELAAGEREAFSILEVPPAWGDRPYRLHPALVDGALQTIAMLAGKSEGVELPFSVDEVWAYEALPSRVLAHAEIESESAGHRTYRISLAREDGVLIARLGGYLVRRLGKLQVTPSYLAPEWVPVAGAKTVPALRGCCLVFDETGEIASDLTRSGFLVRQVVRGESYRADSSLVQIRPAVVDDYERLLRESGEVGAIVHRWAKPRESLSSSLELGFRSVHLLTQALIRAKSAEAEALLFVHPADEPVYEAVAAYAKSVRHEHAGIRWKTLAVSGEAAGLAVELTGAMEDVRYHQGRREVRSLRAWIPDSDQKLQIARDGVCVITGGAGGLGLIFAEYLVEQCDARVVLVGRSTAGQVLRDRLARWQGRATYVVADISTRDGAERAVREARTAFGPVTGVLHAAGQLHDGLVARKRWSDVETVLRPKVQGVEALDAATREEPLEWFVLFSSSVGLLGNAGQSDYAFANAYLDAFAHSRARAVSAGLRSGKTLSLNWPLWADGGMQARDSAQGMLGLLPLERSLGIEIFEKALAGSAVQVWGFVGDANRVRATLLGAPPAVHARRNEAKPYAARDRGEIETSLRSIFSALSKMPLDQIKVTEPLERYGMDSILAVEFSRRIAEDFGEVSQALVFEHPSIAALSSYLAERNSERPVVPSMAGTTPVQTFALPLAPAPTTASAPLPTRLRRQVALAPIDYAFVAPKRLAMQVLYYFERPLEFSSLRRGLARAGEAFFPVNSKLQRHGKDGYVVRESSDEADFAEVRCDASVGLPVEGQPASLDPFRTSFDPTQRGEKLAKFRLYQLRHGSVLAVHVSHAIADGYSFYYFMSAWAAACRGEPFLVPDHGRGVLRELVRQYERQRKMGGDTGRALADFELSEVDARIDPTTLRVDTLSFDAAALLDEARRKAGPMELPRLSENSVLTAHIWKHYAAALREEARTLTLSCPVNFRRQSGRLTHAFFGNASAPAVVRLPRQQVLEAKVPSLAAAVTDAVRACDETTLAAYHAAVERIRLARGLSGVNRTMLADPLSALVVTNVARFPLPPMDFGSGPCTADFNLHNYAGTAVIVAGSGDTLKVRIGYPSSTAAQSAVA